MAYIGITEGVGSRDFSVSKHPTEKAQWKLHNTVKVYVETEGKMWIDACSEVEIF